jgi:hypothetical protein
MARNYTVYIQKHNIPLRKALQAAISSLGYKLTVEDEYVPFASSGYLACTLNGEDAGLMVRFVNSDSHPPQDAVISLQWSADPREKATANIIALALASQFDAWVYDENAQALSLDILANLSQMAVLETES